MQPTLPPNDCTVSATMLSPSPVPRREPRDPARTNRSKMRSRSACRHPRPLVVHRHQRVVAHGLGRDGGQATRVQVGVVEQVDQRPAQLLLVDPDDERRVGQLQGDVAVSGLERVPHELAQVDLA